MKIDPIPIELLTDSVTLLTPTDSGYSRTVLGNVRVIRTSTVHYQNGIPRNSSEMT